MAASSTSKTKNKRKKTKKALVFGVFDGFHKGHENFLKQALKLCDKLVVAVTLPNVIEALKKRDARHSYEERASKLSSFDRRLKVVPGDRDLGKWAVLSEHNPDLILLGYDQYGIARELERMNIPFKFLKPYRPTVYKSSLLNG